jgi:mono/diheme cytochrome c family protein
MWRLAISVLLLAACAGVASADELADRGRSLLATHCASCHAIGRTGASPHVGAPPFRRIGERVDIEAFDELLRAGLSSPHQDMPSFRFAREDARAVRAYLSSIQE